MSNDLTNYNTPGNDGWGDAADEAGKRVVRGTLLKFSDWNWTAGNEGRTVEKGTELIALATAAAWVKWADGKPAQYEMRPPGRGLPARESLDDLDEDSGRPDRMDGHETHGRTRGLSTLSIPKPPKPSRSAQAVGVAASA